MSDPARHVFNSSARWSDSIPRPLLHPLYQRAYGVGFREQEFDYANFPNTQRAQQDLIHIRDDGVTLRVEEKKRNFRPNHFYGDILAEVQHVGRYEAPGWASVLAKTGHADVLAYFWIYHDPSWVSFQPDKWALAVVWSDVLAGLVRDRTGQPAFSECACVAPHRSLDPTATRHCVFCGSIWAPNEGYWTRNISLSPPELRDRGGFLLSRPGRPRMNQMEFNIDESPVRQHG